MKVNLAVSCLILSACTAQPAADWNEVLELDKASVTAGKNGRPFADHRFPVEHKIKDKSQLPALELATVYDNRITVTKGGYEIAAV